MNTEKVEFTVNLPSAEEFAKQYRAYSSLVHNDFQFVFELLMSPDSFVRARVATLDLGLPAVSGIAEIVYQAVQAHGTIEWNSTLKQFIGATICSLMTANGFEKTGQKKAIPHHAFTKGEFYRQAK